MTGPVQKIGWDRFFFSGALVFLLAAAGLSVAHRDVFAEKLGVVVYVLFVFGTISLFFGELKNIREQKTANRSEPILPSPRKRRRK